MILLAEPGKALWFVIFLLVLQQVEGNLIYPRVVGKSVGLPGLLVLMAVTIGGEAFGILGMLFSVPVCAVLFSLYLEFMKKAGTLYVMVNISDDSFLLAVEFCMIRLLNLESAKHEKAAICAAQSNP